MLDGSLNDLSNLLIGHPNTLPDLPDVILVLKALDKRKHWVYLAVRFWANRLIDLFAIVQQIDGAHLPDGAEAIHLKRLWFFLDGQGHLDKQPRQSSLL